MFASHGMVAIAPDVGRNAQGIKDARLFLQTTEDYPVDPTNIHLMGYSAGAQGVLSNGLDPVRTTHFTSFVVISGIHPKNLQGHSSNTNPILLIQAQNDGIYGAAGSWPVVTSWVDTQIASDNGKTKFLAYKDGGHQPIQQCNFFYEALKFMKDPDNYVVPSNPGSIFTSGSFSASPVTKIHSKGCYVNGDGIEPMITMNVWSGNTGQATCLAACKQVKGCVAFDWLKKKAADGMNCALFTESCTTPLQPSGFHYTWAGYDGEATAAYCTAA